MKERLCCDEQSLLVLKPEVAMLTGQERSILEASLVRNVPCLCLKRTEVQLSADEAADFWSNISHFPWFEKYCELMSSHPLQVVVVKGADTASKAKRVIRVDLQLAIERLTEEYGQGFTLDIVHGSEPQDIDRELSILKMQL